MTADDCTTAALQALGVIGASETPAAADLEYGFKRLNQLVDAWAAKKLTKGGLLRTTKTLASGTTSYTIGTGGDIAIVRPPRIEFAGLILDTSASPTSEVPIEVFSDEAWARILSKALTSSTVLGIYYDRRGYNTTTLRATVHVYPVPTVATLQLVLYTREAIIRFAHQTSTDYLFPPAFERALVHHLAIEIAPAFDQLDPTRLALIRDAAKDAMDDIIYSNVDLEEVSFDELLLGGRGRGGNIRTNA